MLDLMSDFVVPCNFQDIHSGYYTSSQGFAKTTLHLCETVLVVLPPTGKHFLRYK